MYGQYTEIHGQNKRMKVLYYMFLTHKYIVSVFIFCLSFLSTYRTGGPHLAVPNFLEWPTCLAALDYAVVMG